MEYDYIIRELESNAIYGRCYKLSKLSVLVATLIKKGDKDVVEYCKKIKQDIDSLSEPYDFNTRLLTSPENNRKINEISKDLIFKLSEYCD